MCTQDLYRFQFMLNSPPNECVPLNVYSLDADVHGHGDPCDLRENDIAQGFVQHSRMRAILDCSKVQEKGYECSWIAPPHLMTQASTTRLWIRLRMLLSGCTREMAAHRMLIPSVKSEMARESLKFFISGALVVTFMDMFHKSRP